MTWLRYGDQKPEHGQEAWVFKAGGKFVYLLTYRHLESFEVFKEEISWAGYHDFEVHSDDLWQPSNRPEPPTE